MFHSTQHDCWIMVDTPKYGPSSVRAVESLTGMTTNNNNSTSIGGIGPKYLILTHVDDTAGHNDWKDHYGDSLQRVFHTGDLGRYNWIGDKTLDDVEVLLPSPPKKDGPLSSSSSSSSSLQAYDLMGNPISDEVAAKEEVVLLHTPGHSPGSISILYRPGAHDVGTASNDTIINGGVLFTGDTYAYRRSTDAMTGFPRYGNNRRQQIETLHKLLPRSCSTDDGEGQSSTSWFDWSFIAPGHGHVRDYSHIVDRKERHRIQREEMESAINELEGYNNRRRW